MVARHSDEFVPSTGPRYVRVAVVQLAYHPAVPGGLTDPLFELTRARSSLLPDGQEAPPRVVRAAYKDLERRVRDAYISQLRCRLEAILDQCRNWEVRIVVLPEYSIPVDLLEGLAERYADMVIVAGTHFVDKAALDSGIYARLGAATKPELRNAVCPVLYGGHLRGLVAKIHLVEEEVRLDVKPGSSTWRPVDLPEFATEPMGVLICRDYLDRGSASHRELMGELLSNCRFLAVPSLTPPHSTPTFDGHSKEDAHHRGQPVLYANVASGGGTTIHVDERRPFDVRNFPAHAGRLEPKEEGVIVADVNLAYDRTGKSTRYHDVLPIRPFAAATFVYRGIEREYAQWLEALLSAIALGGEREENAISAAAQYVSAGFPPPYMGGTTRGRRLEILEYELEEIASLGRIKQLTREVILPDDVLPLPVLRAALALGAAQVIEAWYTRDHVGNKDLAPFAHVHALLKNEADNVLAKQTSWSDEMRRAVRDVVDQVRGSAAKADVRTVPIDALKLVFDAFEPRLKEKVSAIEEYYQAGRYETARNESSELATLAERLSEAAADELRKSRLLRLASECRLNEAVVSLNMGEIEHARDVLPRIRKEFLTLNGKRMLVQVLGGLRYIDEARALLMALAAETIDAAELAREQLALDILDGKSVGEFDSTTELHALAAQRYFNERNLGAAASHALRALKKAEDKELSAAIAAHILVLALHNTVFEADGVQAVSENLREEIVLCVDDALWRLQEKPLPPMMKRDLAYAEELFRRDCQDLDWTPPAGRESSDSLDDDRLVVAAHELARQGKVDEALATLPRNDHPWHGGLRRVLILRTSGKLDEALAEAKEVAAKMPGKMPIEYELATLLRIRGHLQEACVHAKNAFDALPGNGQRCLLADLMLRVQKPKEAWQLLQPVNTARAGSQTVMLLARAAEVLDPGQSTQFWKRYLELRPDDVHVQMHWAHHLAIVLGRPAEAADFAWKVFDEHGAKLELEELARCAGYQRVASLSDVRQHDRIRAILKHVRERFPGHPEAELLRFQFANAAGLEEDEEAANIDLELVQRAANVVKFEAVEPVIEWMEQRAAWLNNIDKLVRRGMLPVAMGAYEKAIPLSLWVEQVFRRRREEVGFFCPPVATRDETSLAHLRGANLLMTHFELLLLQELDLLDPLRDALDSGKLILFPSMVEKIAGESLSARQSDSAYPNQDEHRAAARRAVDLHTWVGRGIAEQWIHVLPCPEAPAYMPPLRDAQNAVSQRFVLEPIEHALGYRVAMQGDAMLYFLTADYFMHQPHGDMILFRHFDWQDGQPRAVDELLTDTNRRTVFLPDVVRWLVQNRMRRARCLEMLADIGFADALGPEESLALSTVASKVLDHHEWMARDLTTAAGERARIRLALVYSNAIFRAFGCHDDDDPPIEGHEARASALLGRLEKIDERRGACCVEMAVEHLGLLTANRWTSAWRQVSDESAEYRLKESGPSHALWGFVSNWLGTDPARRAAYGRAAREVWLTLDAGAEGAAAHGIINTVFVAFPTNIARTNRLDFLDAQTESVAILSACWEYRPLAGHGVRITDDQGSYDIDAEDVLAHGARVLETSNAISRFGDGRGIEFGYPIESRKRMHRVWAPFEALLLRMPSEARKRIASDWKSRQGPHDGRAYTLLEQIEKGADPRDYARWAASALFRQVRDDPAALYTWAHAMSAMRQPGKTQIEELLEILSEPKDGIGVEKSLFDVLKYRVNDGEWAAKRRVDHLKLLAMAAEIPGSLPAPTLQLRFLHEELYAEQVEYALRDVDNPDEMPSGRLAGTILFLRTAVARQPFVNLAAGTVDLREIVPDRFALLLQRVMEAPKKDTLADHETALLQVCAGIIQRIVQPNGISIRNGLWLTWRLFQWLCRQLDTLEPDARREGMRRLALRAPVPEQVPKPMDRLDPFGFGRDKFDIRLAAVLHAFGTMEEILPVFASDSKAPHTISSKKLEENLLALASRHPELDLSSELDWNAPGTIPDLALLALLRVNLAAFGDVPVETRRRHFAALPEDPNLDAADEKQRSGANRLPDAIMHAIFVTAERLESDERNMLVEKLREMKHGPTSQLWKCIAFTALFAAGERSVEDELTSLFVDNVADDRLAIFVGVYLMAISEAAVDRLDVAVDKLVDGFVQASQSPIPIALGLGRVCHGGGPDAQRVATAKLAALAKRSPFCDDDRVKELVGFLGVNHEATDV